MLRSLVLFLWVAAFPVASPPAEPPGSNALAPLPFGANPESSAVAVPGKVSLAPATGFS